MNLNRVRVSVKIQMISYAALAAALPVSPAAAQAVDTSAAAVSDADAGSAGADMPPMVEQTPATFASLRSSEYG